MNNISQEVLEQIRKAIKIPTGTFVFVYSSEDLMNPAHLGGVIFELPSGAHVFRLERTNDFFLKFYYASAGTGTRVATIDLKGVPSCNQVIISFTWSPEEINLYFSPNVQDGRLFSSKGEPCKFQLYVGEDGHIYQIGDENTNVMSVNIFQNGKQILSPTAIDSWKDTKTALEILETGKSDEGYIYELIVANLTISILITGFEAYAKKRVLELEKEGIIPDTEAFFTNSEKEDGSIDIFKKEATEKKCSLLQHIVEKRVINFQNYEQCKRAYNKIFQISFGSIGLNSNTLNELQKFIVYRHRIIHISALIGMLNQQEAPPEEPVIPNKILATKAIETFDLFISKLHESTLKKR